MKLSSPYVVVLLALAAFASFAQQAPPDIIGTNSSSFSRTVGDSNIFKNGVISSNEYYFATAEEGFVNTLTGDVQAEGDIVILDRGHIWRGTNVVYNFKTGAVRAGSFKTVDLPYTVAGESLGGDAKAQVYRVTNAWISTDDYAKPIYRIRARTMTIAPGKYVEMNSATLYLGTVPIFYWPYYRKSLGEHRNNFEFIPGERGSFGFFLLSAYNWYGNSNLDGTLHLDERTRRGIAGGPDLLFHLGDLGQAAFRYYYADDRDPTADNLVVPHLKSDRQRLQFYYTSDPSSTNFTAKILANYENDPLIIRDFFEREYRGDVEPNTFAEVNQLWPNFTLNVLAQPRLVNFFETVERLPDVRVTGLPQQLGNTPVFYQSESSVGYFRRDFSDTNNPLQTNYSATRADTVQQFTLPETYFGWLTVTPRIGGRETYYSAVEGVATPTNAQTRGVFNTGVDFSTKISRVYRDVESSTWDVHDLRHIIEPDINYAYVPAPSRAPSQLPQFDTEMPSLRLLPIEYPDYNSIDSVDKQNLLRLTLRNILQTKRQAGVEDFINWAVYTDWNLTPGTNHTFSDLYSDLTFRPRNWLILNSSVRYDLPDHRWRDGINTLTINPNNVWSASLSYRYLMNNDPEFQTVPGQFVLGRNLIGVSTRYRLNENWAVRVAESYDADIRLLQEQDYTIYRDMRSWTAAVTVRVTHGEGQPADVGAYVTFSFKAFPRMQLGADSDRPRDAYTSSSVLDSF